MRYMPPPNCRNCADRYEACQDSCSVMLDWKAEHLRRKKEEFEKRAEIAIYENYRKAQCERSYRK